MSINLTVDYISTSGSISRQEVRMELLTALFMSISIAEGIPANLLEALCFVESSHRPQVVHKHDGKDNKHSYGICQIKMATAKHMGFKGTIKQLMKPELNIYYAAKYLKYQIKRYKNNYARAITAYNQGSSDNGASEYQVKVFNKWVELNEKRRKNDKTDSI